MADRRLQVFHAVARHGSFTRAAEALFMTQPAVTFQIKQLEEHFNSRLLERGHGKVSLTPAGEIVMAYAERILGLSDELEARIAELTDELTGVLNLGTSPLIGAYWLPGLLDRFKRKYPRVTPRVFVSNSEAIENRVLAREIDIGLVEKTSDEAALECRELCRDELVAVVPPGHMISRAPSVRAEDLLPYPYVDCDPGAAIRALAEAFFRAGNVAPEQLQRAAEIGSLAVIKHLVRVGAGFAITARAMVARNVEHGDMVAVALEPRVYSTLSLLVLRDKFRARLHTTFADFAAEDMRRQAMA